MFRRTRVLISTLFLGTLLGWTVDELKASAAPAEPAPNALLSIIEQVEAAANAQDVEQTMALYSDTFEGPDGFTRSQYQETLRQFWSQYTTLTYEVDLLSWETDGAVFFAETLTSVQGLQQTAGRGFTLTAQIRSRQRIENGQIVSQEILSEQSHLESGIMPPTVEIQLPGSVSIGQRFTFDAIVKEPLGDRQLLGIALNEGVTADDFLVPRPLDLERLAAGGLFKIGRAPNQADQRWVSSVLIREDGIAIDTRRLQVGE